MTHTLRSPTSVSVAPCACLLSNGRYMVMIDAAGSGFSRWRGLAVTRWREDPTRDSDGSYVLLRDRATGATWSAGIQPYGGEPQASAPEMTAAGARFCRHDRDLATKLDVAIAGEADAELRRVTVLNHGDSPRDIDITSYAELVLGSAAADAAHPAFSKMFVETEWDPRAGVLLATRRRRSPDEPVVWAAHFAAVDDQDAQAGEYETDRARFLGRGRILRDAMAMQRGRALSNTVGAVLDPVFSMRRRVVIAPGEGVRVAFWTVAAGTRDEALACCRRLAEVGAPDRALDDAVRHEAAARARLAVDARQADWFQRFVAPLVHADATWRSPPVELERGAGGAPVLWTRGISGDRPIILMRIDDDADLDVARELLLAQRYWQSRQFGVDVVMLNTARGIAADGVHAALQTLQTTPPIAEADAVAAELFVLRDGDVDEALRDGLATVARVVIDAADGGSRTPVPKNRGGEPSATEHSGRVAPFPAQVQVPRVAATRPSFPPGMRQGSEMDDAEAEGHARAPSALEFDNGIGGFAGDGGEYVITLSNGECTPTPWVNVIANPGFGFLVSAEGGGYTWAVNSQQNPLTPWPNDPVSDSPHDLLYLRDDDSGELWSATPNPIRVPSTTYTITHGKGYSRFEHDAHGLEVELLQYVPVADSVKLSRLRIRNRSGRPRRLAVTAYVEWALGPNGTVPGPFVVTSIDAATGALLARNAWRAEFGERVAFIDLGGLQRSASGDRAGFLGNHGTLERPAALDDAGPLSGRVGAGLDPCGALQTPLHIAPGATTEIVFMLGDAPSQEHAQATIEKFRSADLDAVFREVQSFWNDILGTVRVRTPDRALDILHNDWLLYQTLACRVFARTAYYQASGAYGFRDQLQDVMALCLTRPDVAREHLLRAAARQFPEGDVQHWWLPPSGEGIRTRMTDDRVWLPYVAAHYVEVTADDGLLDEPVPFIEGRTLRDGEAEAFYRPVVGTVVESLYEHCARALDVSLSRGAHGLPLIGTGDWNDGMNRVGAQGRGESVWLAWFLIAAIEAFIPHAEARDDHARVAAWRDCRSSLRAALEITGWDGRWYRRGYFDDGTPLGSSDSAECRIDAIAQSWSAIAGAANASHPGQAMAAVANLLIMHDEQIALLLTPPFDRSAPDPGYIRGYPPGIRENGGQYTHGAVWSILAFAMLGQGDRAGELHAMLNPIHHSRTRSDAERYRVEPYVACADVYSVAPHVGRGGWTWYTGSAGWLYRAGLEALLGFRVHGETLSIDPCIPKTWPRYEITFRRRGPAGTITRYDIVVENPRGVNRRVAHAALDGVESVEPDGVARFSLCDDGALHRVDIVLG